MRQTFQRGVFTRRSEGRLYCIDRSSQALDDTERGCIDLTFVGSDVLTEQPRLTLKQEVVTQLSCMMVLAVSSTASNCDKRDMIVATSYPKALAQFMAKQGITNYQSVYRSGKVENAIARGIANAIFDIRETGKSLTANSLAVVALGKSIDLCAVWRRQV